MSMWPKGMMGGTEQQALSWDEGHWGRFTLATIAKPNAHAFPYSHNGDREWTSYYRTGFTGFEVVYRSGPPTPAKRLAELTRPNEESFPYALKPRGWARATDPFQAEAKRRLAAERAA